MEGWDTGLMKENAILMNYNGYCSAEVDKLIDRQSIEPDTQKRKKLV